MSGLKTILTGAWLFIAANAATAQMDAVPQGTEARLMIFAQCAGRFSAQMEHEWLLGRDGAGPEAGRHQMVSLIDAIGPQGTLTGRDLLAVRIETKLAHAALLSRATFGGEPRARALAARYLAQCAELSPAPLDLAALR